MGAEEDAIYSEGNAMESGSLATRAREPSIKEERQGMHLAYESKEKIEHVSNEVFSPK